MGLQSDSASTLETLPGRWARGVQGDLEALRELAASYWYCVYVWWRRTGLEAEQAATATVASFTRWTGTAPPGIEDSAAGLMRQWLPARLEELAEEEWEQEGEPAIAVEREWAEERYADEPEGEAGTLFNRRWTLTVLEFAMQGLFAEYASRGLERLFAEASPFVGYEGADEASYAVAAERMGMTLGTMKRAIFDLRTHHHDLLRTIVADTVADPADVDGEITALLCSYEMPGDAGANPSPLPTAIRRFKPDELLVRAMNSVRMTSGGIGGNWKPPSDEEAARLFPQYEMRGLVGRGAMGAVYRAHQVTLDRDVAIKLLPLEVSVDRAFADRFVREARAMAKLSHPNIITVYNFGTTIEGHLFFVMEYVEGSDLSQIIRSGGLAPDRALIIAGQVCMALAYAHGKGVIHRDIKPANVMMNTEGEVKVADFGLARLNDSNREQAGRTVTGTVLGTEEYMAPEQKRGMPVDHRADIFSMGVMLYEMLCKEPPMGAFESPSERVGCDERIDQIVLKAMHRVTEDRYQTATEMKIAIDAARAPLVPTHQLLAATRPAQPATRQVRRPPQPINAAGSRTPSVASPKKSSAGMIVGMVFAVLLAAAATYILKSNRKPEANTIAQVSNSEKPSPLSTPAPDPPTTPSTKNPSELKTPGDLPANGGAASPLAKATAPESEMDAESVANAPAPKSAMEKWLDEVDGPQQMAFEEQVAKPFAAGLEALRKRYLTSLDAGQAKASATGKLEQAIVWHDERRAFEETGSVEAADDTTPAALRPLRSDFRQRLAQIESERTSRAKRLHASYDAILTSNINLLKQRGRTEDAQLLEYKREEIAVAWQGRPAASRWPKKLNPLVESSVQNPDDTYLAMRVAALQVWYGSNADYEATCERMLKWAGNKEDAVIAERVAKIACLEPGIKLRIRKAALVLAERSVRLGQQQFNLLPYFDMALGMAHYRNGHYSEANSALASAAQTDPSVGTGVYFVKSTSGFFHAMSLAKQGKFAEARELFTITEAKMTPLPSDEKTAFGENSNHDDLITWLAHREAKALIAPHGAGAAPDGYVDLLTPFTPAIVEQTGQGWRMKEGALYSPKNDRAAFQLPGTFSGSSYQISVKVQQIGAGKDTFHIALPVGDRMTGFELDGLPKQGRRTGLFLVDDGKPVEGKQVKDNLPHDLEVSVRLDGTKATISAKLDTRALLEWAGPVTALSQFGGWAAITKPGSLALGSCADDWVASEVKVRRLDESAARFDRLLEIRTLANGWEDLLAKLTPALVGQNGQGWRVKDGAFFSPAGMFRTLPLPGSFAGASYRVHLKLRQITPAEVFHIILPVGDHMTGFDLEGFPQDGTYTGMNRVDGNAGRDLPGAVRGKQVKDSLPHGLEVAVDLDGANATIAATLDARPLYEWTGPIAALSQQKYWAQTPPGLLALGSCAADWAVSEVKVKRLAK